MILLLELSDCERYLTQNIIWNNSHAISYLNTRNDVPVNIILVIFIQQDHTYTYKLKNILKNFGI